jgi:hypothetical protein
VARKLAKIISSQSARKSSSPKIIGPKISPKSLRCFRLRKISRRVKRGKPSQQDNIIIQPENHRPSNQPENRPENHRPDPARKSSAKISPKISRQRRFAAGESSQLSCICLNQ